MITTVTTLRPGFLVSLKTSLTGNVSYKSLGVSEQDNDKGEKIAHIETERKIRDPQEHERGIKARSKSRAYITGVCASTDFGLMCPQADADRLEAAIAQARAEAAAFNATASYSRLKIRVVKGRVAPDDLDAIQSMNGEIVELLEQMEQGLGGQDATKVREAASRAKSIAMMLSPEAAAKVQLAIDTARDAATRIVKAEKSKETIPVDTRALRTVSEQKGLFIDLDDVGEVSAPSNAGRSVDMTDLAI